MATENKRALSQAVLKLIASVELTPEEKAILNPANKTQATAAEKEQDSMGNKPNAVENKTYKSGKAGVHIVGIIYAGKDIVGYMLHNAQDNSLMNYNVDQVKHILSKTEIVNAKLENNKVSLTDGAESAFMKFDANNMMAPLDNKIVIYVLSRCEKTVASRGLARSKTVYKFVSNTRKVSSVSEDELLGLCLSGKVSISNMKVVSGAEASASGITTNPNNPDAKYLAAKNKDTILTIESRITFEKQNAPVAPVVEQKPASSKDADKIKYRIQRSASFVMKQCKKLDTMNILVDGSIPVFIGLSGELPKLPRKSMNPQKIRKIMLGEVLKIYVGFDTLYADKTTKIARLVSYLTKKYDSSSDEEKKYLVNKVRLSCAGRTPEDNGRLICGTDANNFVEYAFCIYVIASVVVNKDIGLNIEGVNVVPIVLYNNLNSTSLNFTDATRAFSHDISLTSNDSYRVGLSHIRRNCKYQPYEHTNFNNIAGKFVAGPGSKSPVHYIEAFVQNYLLTGALTSKEDDMTKLIAFESKIDCPTMLDQIAYQFARICVYENTCESSNNYRDAGTQKYTAQFAYFRLELLVDAYMTYLCVQNKNMQIAVKVVKGLINMITGSYFDSINGMTRDYIDHLDTILDWWTNNKFDTYIKNIQNNQDSITVLKHYVENGAFDVPVTDVVMDNASKLELCSPSYLNKIANYKNMAGHDGRKFSSAFKWLFGISGGDITSERSKAARLTSTQYNHSVATHDELAALNSNETNITGTLYAMFMLTTRSEYEMFIDELNADSNWRGTFYEVLYGARFITFLLTYPVIIATSKNNITRPIARHSDSIMLPW